MGTGLARVWRRRILAAALLGSAPICAAQPAFEADDLYLVSKCLPDGGGGCASGVVRVRPGDWSVERIAEFAPGDTCQRGAYDAFRDALIVGGEDVFEVHADGSVLPLGDRAGVTGIAATGDGLLYLCASTWLYVYDAADLQHDLLDSGGAPVQMFEVTSLWYDAPSHSLLAGQSGDSSVVVRMPLSADGLSLVGEPLSSSYDSSPGSPEGPVGMSTGPGGSVFVKVDDNTNNSVPRMLLFDVPTMSFSVFASSDYFGVAAETGGAYSAAAGGGIVVDTSNDALRLYGAGGSGGGAVVVDTGISGLGGGEWCQLFVVESGPCLGDFNGDGVANILDVLAFLNAWVAQDSSADFNHDGVVNILDVLAFLNAWVAGC